MTGDQSQILLKFRKTNELVLSCALFSKMMNHYPHSDDLPDNQAVDEQIKEALNIEDVVIDLDSYRLINALKIDT